MSFMSSVKSFIGIKQARPTNIQEAFLSKGHTSSIGLNLRNPRLWLRWKKTNPRLNPVEKIANDLGAIKVSMMLGDNEVENSKAVALLESPNDFPGFSYFNLRKITHMYIDLLGECFWLMDMQGNEPSRIFPIPPYWVQKIDYNRREYEVRMGGRLASGTTMKVPFEQMVYFKDIDVEDPYDRGSGYARPIGDELETDEYMSKYQKTTFMNDGTPPMIVGLKGANSESIREAKQSWRSKHSGLKNAHEPAFVNADSIAVQIIKQTAKDLDFVNSRKFLRDLTIEHFNIPKEVMGIVENSNRATITQAQTIYAKNVLKPRDSLFIDTLNAQYVPMFREQGKLESEDFIPDDVEFQLQKANDGLKGSALTIDEWRIENGWDPLPNGQGQVRLQPLAVIEVRVTPDEEEEVDNPDITGEMVDEVARLFSPSRKTLEGDAAENFWKQVDNAAISNEKATERSMKKFFQGQQGRVTENLQDILKSLTELMAKAENITLGQVFDLAEENRILYEVLFPHWEASTFGGFQVANNTFDFGLSWDVVRPEFIEAVEEYGFTQVNEINNTTRDQLVEELKEAIQEGESIPMIRDRISGVYSEAKQNRSILAARTETHNATVHGTFITYDEAGIKQKQWLTTIDNRERGWHADMNGQLKNMNEPFVSGQGNELMHPGDPFSGVSSEVVQCRCALLPVFE